MKPSFDIHRRPPTKDRPYEVYLAPPPDQLRELMIPLNTKGRKVIGARMGAEPGRATLFRWRRDGYPVDRNGPRVILPSVRTLKKIHTSVPALERFFEVVQWLGDEIRKAGSVSDWREQQREGP